MRITPTYEQKYPAAALQNFYPRRFLPVERVGKQYLLLDKSSLTKNDHN